MLNPRVLGFTDDDDVTRPQAKSPFRAKKKAPQPAEPPGSLVPDHPANPHLHRAIASSDARTKQQHVFRALSAIRKAAVKTTTP